MSVLYDVDVPLDANDMRRPRAPPCAARHQPDAGKQCTPLTPERSPSFTPGYTPGSAPSTYPSPPSPPCRSPHLPAHRPQSALLCRSGEQPPAVPVRPGTAGGGRGGGARTTVSPRQLSVRPRPPPPQEALWAHLLPAYPPPPSPPSAPSQADAPPVLTQAPAGRRGPAAGPSSGGLAPAPVSRYTHELVAAYRRFDAAAAAAAAAGGARAVTAAASPSRAVQQYALGCAQLAAQRERRTLLSQSRRVLWFSTRRGEAAKVIQRGWRGRPRGRQVALRRNLATGLRILRLGEEEAEGRAALEREGAVRRGELQEGFVRRPLSQGEARHAVDVCRWEYAELAGGGGGNEGDGGAGYDAPGLVASVLLEASATAGHMGRSLAKAEADRYADEMRAFQSERREARRGRIARGEPMTASDAFYSGRNLTADTRSRTARHAAALSAILYA